MPVEIERGFPIKGGCFGVVTRNHGIVDRLQHDHFGYLFAGAYIQVRVVFFGGIMKNILLAESAIYTTLIGNKGLIYS